MDAFDALDPAHNHSVIHNDGRATLIDESLYHGLIGDQGGSENNHRARQEKQERIVSQFRADMVIVSAYNDARQMMGLEDSHQISTSLWQAQLAAEPQRFVDKDGMCSITNTATTSSGGKQPDPYNYTVVDPVTGKKSEIAPEHRASYSVITKTMDTTPLPEESLRIDSVMDAAIKNVNGTTNAKTSGSTIAKIRENGQDLGSPKPAAGPTVEAAAALEGKKPLPAFSALEMGMS